MFTTRDCLNFGPRGAVDKALSRLVSQKTITRLARGVFVRSELFVPTPVEICRAKANAFGKDIAMTGLNAASQFGFADHHPRLFLVSGCSSSFEYVGGRIEMRGASAKKMRLADAPCAIAIRALWHMGKEFATEHLSKVASMLTASDIGEIRRSSQWMPSWLAQLFIQPKSAHSVDRPGVLGRFEELHEKWLIAAKERAERIAAKVSKRIEEDRLLGVISTPKTVRMRLDDFF